MKRGLLKQLGRDLEAPIEARGFGTGWFSGFFALVLAIFGLCCVLALRWPEWTALPELAVLRDNPSFRMVVHGVLLAAYALALLSLLLRPRKALGLTALLIALAATILGGAAVQARETHDWGIFFGVDFFAVNMIATGLMFAPVERLFPHKASQRLFRTEWREDLFYFLVSSMMVQLLTFLNLAPSSYINAHVNWLAGTREFVSGLPWLVQFAAAMFLTDLAQYWFHRMFHRVPFLWGFHAVHHSAKSMDWLAGARMHFIEIVLLRSVTSLPLLTLGFLPSVMQAYVGVVYVWSSLLHANVRGDFNALGQWIALPRFHHWHHAIEREGVDKNFAIHFPILDRIFGTYYLPESRWPSGYGVPEKVPSGYFAQFTYPFVRKRRKNG
ncbi:sterol desaturase family protein [Altererythrobacter xixiisoli]|uniref:Sterol desaturase family protein n=1 Tax=Croceibacterium xixiisoli TaxID=1476466 RepID=A0A6I4U175_9SPHN|nr:sterol desaturase family protein [Croceibacterium xixiisoli]MXP00414.1 sterol desaturase family protein [Croceibacterium xixiisoli]